MVKFAVALLACGLLAAASAAPQKHFKPNHLHPRKSFDTMIVGGEDAEEGELPYQVSLRYFGGHYCGGSVIDVNGTQLVITAAHCVEDEDPNDPDSTVLAGEHDQSRTSPNEQSRTVTRFIMHEDYDYWTSVNDIAILFLDRPFQLTNYVQPIPLPSRMQDTRGEIVVSGWGRLSSGGPTPDILQKVQIPIVDDATCQKAYPEEIVLPSALCAGLLEEGGKDSCQGDSGGPLKAVDGGYLAGIVSWGYGCAAPGLPGVNTEVSHFIDWISANLRNL